MFMESIELDSIMTDAPPVRTALFEEHLALDANMVDSVSYTHLTLPTKA